MLTIVMGGGAYGNIREMNARCANMSTLPPVLRKYCTNTGKHPNKPNKPNNTAAQRWKTAGTYATMYNKPSAGNRMKWAVNSAMHAAAQPSKPNNATLRFTIPQSSKDRAQTIRNANALVRNLQKDTRMRKGLNRLDNALKRANNVLRKQQNSVASMQQAAERKKTLNNANRLLKNLRRA
mgnify:CR=1 FL=1